MCWQCTKDFRTQVHDRQLWYRKIMLVPFIFHPPKMMKEKKKKIQRPLSSKYTYLRRNAVRDANLVQNKCIMAHFVDKISRECRK